MDITAVPQDDIKRYGGLRKGVYARDESGRVVLTTTTGWEVEEIVLMQAVEALQSDAEAARQRVVAGLSSPLEYWMYTCRMDLLLLAQNSGTWRWRVRRHLKPGPFNRLSASQITKYSEALGIQPEQLLKVP